ncbi:MAG: hypothetical protein HQK66_12515, partial [Desulfamplus sp.]|nr:hypothetical protein [Desulfamplus sp.]
RSKNRKTISPYTGPSKEEFEYGLEKFLDEARALAKFEDNQGILVISSLLFMLGNILSDICVALVDPRVRFK